MAIAAEKIANRTSSMEPAISPDCIKAICALVSLFPKKGRENYNPSEAESYLRLSISGDAGVISRGGSNLGTVSLWDDFFLII